MLQLKFPARAFGTVVMALCLVAGAAVAQQPSRIRGQIEKAEGAMLSLKARDGAMLNVKVADDARVSALVKASLADLKPDTFVGIAGMPQADGSIQAFSIHIFLPVQRGVVPDRHGPWDAAPGSTMTNAYIESIVAGKDGEAIMVKYKDGEKKIIVTPQTVIAAVAPGNKSELKAGAQIIIFASEKQPDGSLLAKVMYVGRDVTPAM
jgi:cbb3-type cytochrome oxidase subunit 3